MTQPMWTADIDIDTALVTKLVGEQFPALRGATVEPFGIGWDNAAFLAGGRIVFRFPRRRACVHLIEREIALLPLVAPHVPLAIPTPRYVGAATADYPWPFAGYDLIEGTTSCSVALSEAARAALAEPLGRFLRALHALDTTPLVARGLPPDELGRLDHRKRWPLAAERVGALAENGTWATCGVVSEPKHIVAWLAGHPPRPLADDARTLVHGDLYARHVLLDADARPSGIIDWGDVHLGDPALDVEIAHLLLPGTAHAAFRAAYGGVDERTWEAARYRAVYHAILELDYGARTGDAGMRASGATALRLIEPELDG